MIPGSASQEGTARFASRFPTQKNAGFYRDAQELTVSSIGIGSYLGEMDQQTDRGYTEAVGAPVRGGINFVDTSLNYRHQQSERAIGAALLGLLDAGEVERSQVVVCTKAGYLVPGAVPVLDSRDVVGRIHCLAPAFLSDQLERSRRNLQLDTIDVFYLHNPETQLGSLPTGEFYQRMRQAFQALEAEVASGRIRYYGTATWDGYRKPNGAGMSLVNLAGIAREIAGDNHHFRFVQLPYNLAMTEAYALQNEVVAGANVTLLAAAQRLGITVVASASLLQARLSRGLPEQLAELFPGTSTDAQRALQFTRSAPGVSVALVGMSSTAHVAENLHTATLSPMAAASYARMFGVA